MQYQLILQFRGDTLADYDAMIALEEELIEALQDTAEVDGAFALNCVWPAEP